MKKHEYSPQYRNFRNKLKNYASLFSIPCKCIQFIFICIRNRDHGGHLQADK